METIKEFINKYGVQARKSVLKNGDWTLHFNSEQVGICILLDQVTNPFTDVVSYEISFTTCEAFAEGQCDFSNVNSSRTPMRVRGFLLDFIRSLRNDDMMCFIQCLRFDAESKRLNIYIRTLDKEFHVSKESYAGERDTWTIKL